MLTVNDIPFLIRLSYSFSASIVLLTVYMSILSFFTTGNVTGAIATYMLNILLPIGLGSFFYMVFLCKRFTLDFFKENIIIKKSLATMLSFWLLSLIPILSTVAGNFESFILQDIFYFVFVTGFVSFTVTVIVPLTLRKLNIVMLSAVSGASFCFFVFNLASTYQMFISTHTMNISPTIFASLIGVLIIFWLISQSRYATLIALAIFMVLLSYFVYIKTYFIMYDLEMYSKRNSILQYAEKKEIKRRPDIFLLVYDGYVGQDLMSQYHIDNREQENFLVENGFKIYDRIYSVGLCTVSSMDRVLSISEYVPRKFGGNI